MVGTSNQMVPESWPWILPQKLQANSVSVNLPSGRLTEPWKITTFNGKTHYFYGRVQQQTVRNYQRVSHENCCFCQCSRCFLILMVKSSLWFTIFLPFSLAMSVIARGQIQGASPKWLKSDPVATRLQWRSDSGGCHSLVPGRMGSDGTITLTSQQ